MVLKSTDMVDLGSASSKNFVWCYLQMLIEGRYIVYRLWMYRCVATALCHGLDRGEVLGSAAEPGFRSWLS